MWLIGEPNTFKDIEDKTFVIIDNDTRKKFPGGSNFKIQQTEDCTIQGYSRIRHNNRVRGSLPNIAFYSIKGIEK